MVHVTEEVETRKVKPPKRTLKDNLRQVRYNLTTIRANLKFVFRAIRRELKYFLPLQDLAILFLMIGIVLAIFLVILIWGLPLALSLWPGDPLKVWEKPDGLHFNLIKWNGLIFNNTTLRYGAGIIGVGTVIVRLMIKSPILKYRDKVNTKKDVTYLFGTSRPAEQFLFEMIYQYGYEDKVSLIADSDLLWVKKLKGMIDIYVVDNQKEFEKENLYDIIGFKNASRVMILTESIELNQNILTNIRRIRPDIEIVLLSQFAPIFVFSDLVKDENLIIIEDLDTTIQGLVTSLSLDFDFPQTAEIDVPKTFVGHTGDAMSSDIPKVDVLLIRRGEIILPPEEILQKGDRVILHYYSNYMMMLANRVATELPILPTLKKEKRAKKEKSGKKNIVDDKIRIPTVEVPVVTYQTISEESQASLNDIEKKR